MYFIRRTSHQEVSLFICMLQFNCSISQIVSQGDKVFKPIFFLLIYVSKEIFFVEDLSSLKRLFYFKGTYTLNNNFLGMFN